MVINKILEFEGNQKINQIKIIKNKIQRVLFQKNIHLNIGNGSKLSNN